MDLKEIKEIFASPSAEYRGKPFWSWNGELRGEELVRQAHIMKEMGLGGYFMHSRAGLITEYLGDEWFRLINLVADTAEADGMETWLYDEDRYPSGSAGGMATVDPQYRMKSLRVYESAPEIVGWDEGSFALYVARLDGIDLYAYKELDVTCISSMEDAVHAVKTAVKEISQQTEGGLGEWKALRFSIVPDPCDSNFNGTTYIDTMSRSATEKFIELTHEKYAEHCGDRLGRSIKGIFTDEPHRGHCFDDLKEADGVKSCSICWTDDIFGEFEKRYGFACRPILPELFYRKNGERVAPVKLHYIDLANALFLERFAKPLNDWCESHGIIFTGHVLHEDSLMNQTVSHGSLMRFYEYMGYPGVDVLTEHNRCYWIVKQLSSAARQLGKKWLLSELYGCTGWQFDFKSHKAVGDWQALFGINLRCQHLSWYTMEGESKRDYPASILHQSPWYKEYGKVEDHFARMGVLLSEGKPACDVLLLNPIESLWCQAYVGWSKWIFNTSPDIRPYEERYTQLFHWLTDSQIDFDYGEEEMMSRLASVEDENGVAVLSIGNAVYKTVIVSDMLTVRPSTLALLREFSRRGGRVIFCGDVPSYVDAIPSDEPARLAESCTAIPFDEAALVNAVRDGDGEFVSVVNGWGESAKTVFAQVRRDFGGDGYAVAVLNTDREKPSGELVLRLKAPMRYTVEEWDTETGERFDASSVACYTDGVYNIKMSLPAAGTRCFVLTEGSEVLPAVRNFEAVCEKTLTGEFPFTCDEPNACVLDYCRWRWKDGLWSDEEEVLRVDRQIRSSLGIEWRGGSMLQPWYSKLHHKTKYGELQLSYEFYIDRLPEGEIFLAGERPELNNYKINGVALQCGDVNDFWIDECFKKLHVPRSALKLGRNEVTVDVTFMRTTNIEALYLVGDFGVRIKGHRRALIQPPERMGCDSYAAYGMPFYTGNLTLTVSHEDYAHLFVDVGEPADRILLTPKEFTGGCVRVTAGGKSTVLGWEPYEADVTDAVRNGLPIYVTVYGTRANLFGPLHETPRPAPSCGPGNFVTGGDRWTDGYNLLDSGIRGLVFKRVRRL